MRSRRPDPARSSAPRRRTGLAAAAVLASVVLPASAGAVSGGEAVAFLNQHRATAGLPPVAEDPELTEGCRRHVEYMRLNDQVEHVEDPARPGFSPAGLRAAEQSVPSTEDAYDEDGWSTWENAPGHLVQTLNPWIATTGASGGCLNTQGGNTYEFSKIASYGYPGDGTEYPATQRDVEEQDSPAALAGLDVRAPTGPHLFFLAAGPGPQEDYRGTFVRVAVVGPDGPVEARTVDDSGSMPLPPGGVIIPARPLKPGATYTVSVTFQPGGRASSSRLPRQAHTWSFRAIDALVGRTRPTGGTGKVTFGPAPGGGGGGAGGSGGSGTTAARVRSVRLGLRQLRVGASNVGVLRATIEERRTSRGRARWVRVRTVRVAELDGGTATSPRFRALAVGRRYRVTLRTGKGRLVDRRTVRAARVLGA